jgi:hypothetical protein
MTTPAMVFIGGIHLPMDDAGIVMSLPSSKKMIDIQMLLEPFSFQYVVEHFVMSNTTQQFNISNFLDNNIEKTMHLDGFYLFPNHLLFYQTRTITIMRLLAQLFQADARMGLW